MSCRDHRSTNQKHRGSSSSCAGQADEDCCHDNYKFALTREVRVNEEDPLFPNLTLASTQRTRSQGEPRMAKKFGDCRTAIVAGFSRRPVAGFTAFEIAGDVPMWRTRDAGQTWQRVSSPPILPTLYSVFHYELVCGPGPRRCNARWYFVSNTVHIGFVDPVTGLLGNIATALGNAWNRYAITYSDDDGETWSAYRFIDPVALGEPGGQPAPAFGGTISAAVDTFECSPNFGTLYVSYGFQPFDINKNTTSLGTKLIWSCDFSATFHSTELGTVPIEPSLLPAGAVLDTAFSTVYYSRVKAHPCGEVYVLGGQYIQYFLPPSTVSNFLPVTRFIVQGFKVCSCATIRTYTPVAVRDVPEGVFPAAAVPGLTGWNASALLPEFDQMSLAINPVSGAIYVAVYAFELNTTPRGRIFVHRSRNGGQTFPEICVDTAVAGHSSIRPEMDISPDGRQFMLRFTTVEDLPTGTTQSALVGQFHVFSTTSGQSWSRPQPTTQISVRANTLRGIANNAAGLHHRILFLKPFQGIAVYADTRNGSDVSTSIDFGNSDIFAALFRLPNCGDSRCEFELDSTLVKCNHGQWQCAIPSACSERPRCHRIEASDCC